MQTPYQEQFLKKAQKLKNKFQAHYQGAWQIFPSEPQNYRLRAEFRIWHENKQCHYAMSPKGESINSTNKILLENFPPVSKRINQLMPELLKHINKESALKEKLFQIEFLSNLKGDDTLITLIYHRPLDERWQNSAKILEQTLKISIIGRARKQKLILSKDYIYEQISINNNTYHYQQIEQSFSQPNGKINQAMIQWACTQAQTLNHKKDLLELYCGNGNFTLPLSQYFHHVLATEISKTSLRALKNNLQENHIKNIKIARLSAEEFSAAYHKERNFKRLEQQNIILENYQFSMVFVDPPRAGIDAKTLQLLTNFPYILYISCNPHTLLENLTHLPNHQIQQAAFFDQFPYSEHAEVGVLLKNKISS